MNTPLDKTGMLPKCQESITTSTPDKDAPHHISA